MSKYDIDTKVGPEDLEKEEEIEVNFAFPNDTKNPIELIVGALTKMIEVIEKETYKKVSGKLNIPIKNKKTNEKANINLDMSIERGKRDIQ